MHIKKQRLSTPGPTPLYPVHRCGAHSVSHWAWAKLDILRLGGELLRIRVDAERRVYAECAIAKKETLNT